MKSDSLVLAQGVFQFSVARKLFIYNKLVGERGFEPPTPWSRNGIRESCCMFFNLLEWCFDRLSPARSPHSGVNVSPRMEVPDQGFGLVFIDKMLRVCQRSSDMLDFGTVATYVRHSGNHLITQTCRRVDFILRSAWEGAL
jgi:hypothetical protein